MIKTQLFIFTLIFLLSCDHSANKNNHLQNLEANESSFYGTWLGALENDKTVTNYHVYFLNKRFSGNPLHYFSQLTVTNDTLWFEHKCHLFKILDFEYPFHSEFFNILEKNDSIMVIDGNIGGKEILRRLKPANKYNFNKITFVSSECGGGICPVIKFEINSNGKGKFEGYNVKTKFPSFEGFIQKEYFDFIKYQLSLIKPDELNIKEKKYRNNEGPNHKLIIELDNGETIEIDHDIFNGPHSAYPLVHACFFGYNYFYKPL